MRPGTPTYAETGKQPLSRRQYGSCCAPTRKCLAVGAHRCLPLINGGDVPVWMDVVTEPMAAHWGLAT